MNSKPQQLLRISFYILGHHKHGLDFDLPLPHFLFYINLLRARIPFFFVSRHFPILIFFLSLFCPFSSSKGHLFQFSGRPSPPRGGHVVFHVVRLRFIPLRMRILCWLLQVNSYLAPPRGCAMPGFLIPRDS